MKKKYSIILFDADGTLFDFLKAERSALTRCLEHFGIEATDQNISIYSQINDRYWKLLEKGLTTKNELKYKRFRDFLATVGSSADSDAIADMYAGTLGDYHYLIDGAEDICLQLRSVGCRLYIVTNGIKAVQEKRFNESGMAKYFDGFFISEEIGVAKPDATYFEAVSSAISEFDRSDAIIIGDSLTSDILGGKNFGIDTCLYDPQNREIPAEMPIPDYRVAALSDIIHIVLGDN